MNRDERVAIRGMLELLIVVVRGLTLALRGHRDLAVRVLAFRGLPSIERIGA